MSELDYGISYIASAPDELKVGDRVEIIDPHNPNVTLERVGDIGTITRLLKDGGYIVGFGEEHYIYEKEYLRKLPDTISFEEESTESWNVAMFRKITIEMADTYARKNATYNDSFGKSVEKYGFIAALTRISDKFNRIENLILGADNKVPDESLEDSLLDLACYSVMTLVALRGAKIPDVDFENVD